MDSRVTSMNGNLSLIQADREAQEDTLLGVWYRPASFLIAGSPADFDLESNDDMVIELVYRVVAAADGEICIGMASADGERGYIDASEAFIAQAGGDWQTRRVKLSCFADLGVDMKSVITPLLVSGDRGLALQMASIRIIANPGDADCSLA